MVGDLPGDPERYSLGTREDRQEDLGRAALWYIVNAGLGQHFLLSMPALHLTGEETEILANSRFELEDVVLARSLWDHISQGREPMNRTDPDEINRMYRVYCSDCNQEGAAKTGSIAAFCYEADADEFSTVHEDTHNHGGVFYYREQ